MILEKPVLRFSFFLILSTFLFTLPLFGEDSSATTAESNEGSSSTVENSPVLPADTPVPYDEDEFSEFFKGMRRFDVILFGSMPLAFMFTSLFYDFSIYAYHEFDTDYGFGTARTEDDLINMAIITFSVSAVIAIVDIIIYSVKRSHMPVKEISPAPGR